MRFSRPSIGTILGAIALFIALGGTAFAATGTVVNIADPTTPSQIAHVNPGGQLETAGIVTNTVSTELAAPSTYVHSSSELRNGAFCKKIAAPPSGKAMIVRQLRIDVLGLESGGATFQIWDGDDHCFGPVVATLASERIGDTTIPFDPGLAVPANSVLSAKVIGSPVANVFTDGYSVPSSQVPATGVTATGKP